MPQSELEKLESLNVGRFSISTFPQARTGEWKERCEVCTFHEGNGAGGNLVCLLNRSPANCFSFYVPLTIINRFHSLRINWLLSAPTTFFLHENFNLRFARRITQDIGAKATRSLARGTWGNVEGKPHMSGLRWARDADSQESSMHSAIQPWY